MAHCTIIKPRETRTEIYYTLDFNLRSDPSGGFTFPCDSEGNPRFNIMPIPAINNYHYCLRAPQKFYPPQVIKHRDRYTKPAKAKCSCGEEFSLEDQYLGACECPKCHQWYNLFGQALIDPKYWEEGYDYDSGYDY